MVRIITGTIQVQCTIHSDREVEYTYTCTFGEMEKSYWDKNADIPRHWQSTLFDPLTKIPPLPFVS